MISRFFIILSVTAVLTALGGDLQFSPQGLMPIDKSGGSYILSYPTVIDKDGKPIKPQAVKPHGKNLQLDYPQGMSVTATRAGGSITLHFTGIPTAAKSFEMAMPLPASFTQGGRVQLQGEAVTPVPTTFAGEQFIFKGNPKPVTLTDPQGAQFTLAMPYGWQQLQDSRKWNGSGLDYTFTTAMPSNGGSEAWFTFKAWSGDLANEPRPPKPAAAPVAVAAPPKPAPGPKFSVRLTQDGVAIDAGSDGQFTLDFPVFVGERWDDIRKPVERKINGNTATLLFDGDARIDVTLQPHDGVLTLIPANVPPTVRSIRTTMLIDFSYANGGTWKIGDGNDTPFPPEQPPKAHLFQGNAQKLTLRNPAGAAVTVQAPNGTYLQLTDNREWGWKIFGAQLGIPCQTGAGPARIQIASLRADGPAVKLVDRFGQTTRADFAGKVQTEEELKQDVQREADWLAALQPPTLDIYGGLPESGSRYGLQKSGFFHVEKKGSKWFLVDPLGNAFFHLGVCTFNPGEDYTYIAGRETVYEWLPAGDSEFSSAYHPNAYWHPTALSFHLTNRIRKSGQPYNPADYTADMIRRVRKWGFNSVGAFGAGDAGARRSANFPHVAHLPLSVWDGFPDVPGIHGIFDPFSEKLRQQCEKQFAEKLPPQAEDPLLIGYFLANEPLWEQIPAGVAALDASHPCKQQLAQMLEKKYQTVDAFNQAWETDLPSFAAVADRGLPIKTQAAKADMQAFATHFLDAYFSLISETFHRHDRNHMLIGNRFQPQTINNETVCRLSGKYMDIVSFNYYTYGFDLKMLDRVHGWIGDRPMLFSEFYFNSPSDSGLSGGGKDVPGQLARGLAYRHYVENAATLAYVVGIEWFTLIDQATTGRFFEKYTGEAANTGLISVGDRPWRTMLNEMVKTNYGIYSVFFGETPPFHFQNPLFEPAPETEKRGKD